MNIRFPSDSKLNRGPWLRLLGVGEEHLKKAETDEKMHAALVRLQEQMEEAEDMLWEAARPAFAWAVVETADLPVEGVSLAKHLEGCDRLVLMAVTLGPEVDELISETQVSKIALSVVIDCGASVMAELAANLAEEQIRRELAAEAVPSADVDLSADIAPLYVTKRFSPGYGDSPLEMQTQVLGMLDAEHQLGITLSKGFMMSPSKSITAIMGLADHPVTGRLATCEECVLRDKCRFRAEGRLCGTFDN